MDRVLSITDCYTGPLVGDWLRTSFSTCTVGDTAFLAFPTSLVLPASKNQKSLQILVCMHINSFVSRVLASRRDSWRKSRSAVEVFRIFGHACLLSNSSCAWRFGDQPRHLANSLSIPIPVSTCPFVRHGHAQPRSSERAPKTKPKTTKEKREESRKRAKKYAEGLSIATSGDGSDDGDGGSDGVGASAAGVSQPVDPLPAPSPGPRPATQRSQAHRGKPIAPLPPAPPMPQTPPSVSSRPSRGRRAKPSPNGSKASPPASKTPTSSRRPSFIRHGMKGDHAGPPAAVPAIPAALGSSGRTSFLNNAPEDKLLQVFGSNKKTASGTGRRTSERRPKEQEAKAVQVPVAAAGDDDDDDDANPHSNGPRQSRAGTWAFNW